jgi:hypothetical protein
VIDGRIRVFSGGIQQDQYIVFFRRTQEQAYDVQLALAQIARGVERLEIARVLYSEDDDRRGCVDVGVRKILPKTERIRSNWMPARRASFSVE